MRTHRLTIARIAMATAMLVLTFAAASSSGCRWVREKIGIGTVIEDPEPGTPEATIKLAIEAAATPDEDKGWKKFRRLLHSEQRKSPASERSWRENNFRAFRKKWKYYVLDPDKMSFRIVREREYEEEDGTLELFIENSKSEMPTPCSLKKDHDGAWRIMKCSL